MYAYLCVFTPAPGLCALSPDNDNGFLAYPGSNQVRQIFNRPVTLREYLLLYMCTYIPIWSKPWTIVNQDSHTSWSLVFHILNEWVCLAFLHSQATNLHLLSSLLPLPPPSPPLPSPPPPPPQNGEIQVFDAVNLKAVAVIPAHESPLAALAFNGAGTKLASASATVCGCMKLTNILSLV